MQGDGSSSCLILYALLMNDDVMLGKGPALFLPEPRCKTASRRRIHVKKKVDVKEKNPLFMSPILLEIIMSRFTGSGASFKCFKLHLTVKKKVSFFLSSRVSHYKLELYAKVSARSKGP